MDLDLNIEAVVEGDDQALEDFQDLLEVAQEHAQDPMPV
jgi:acylphosphatase